MNYYNEHDPSAIAWLGQLINDKVIPNGHIDTRSICDVTPSDLRGYTQCHFFAGIGGWAEALLLAGWASTRSVWTGSCPCQPFSNAGKHLGHKDERHLWPVFFDLIRQCRPQHVFGEQVVSAVGKGWLDGISADLEAEAYACGAVVLGAHSVGAPHPRQRLYWVADSHLHRRGQAGQCEPAARGDGPVASGAAHGLGNTDGAGLIKHGGPIAVQAEQPATELRSDVGAWDLYTIAHCTDGKARRVGAGVRPLVTRVQGRVGLIRGYGNAIVPQVAAAFIKAHMQS